MNKSKCLLLTWIVKPSVPVKIHDDQSTVDFMQYVKPPIIFYLFPLRIKSAFTKSAEIKDKNPFSTAGSI